jgi:phosphate starvation-inducible PhoH-like protein
VKISIPTSGFEPMLFAGFQDEFLRRVQTEFNITVTMRDECIYLKGDAQKIQEAKKVIQNKLREMTNRGHSEWGHDTKKREKEPFSVTTPKRLVRAKTPGQAEYIEAIDTYDITVSIGPAGTGKTYLGVAMAVSYLLEKKVERIILTRPAVEAGESLGFLPGAIEEKVDPYLRPLYDALNLKIIEVAPLAYMRGRTLNDALIILDEAQNTTGMQMKMFLTRMGWRSKVVVTGDITQVDLPTNIFSGLIEIQHLLKNISGIKFVYLSEKDVVRHNLVQKIIKAYETKNST